MQCLRLAAQVPSLARLIHPLATPHPHVGVQSMSEASHVHNRCLTSPPSLLPASPSQLIGALSFQLPGPQAWKWSLLPVSMRQLTSAPKASPAGPAFKTDPDLEVLSTVTATSQVQAPPPLLCMVATASSLSPSIALTTPTPSPLQCHSQHKCSMVP